MTALKGRSLDAFLARPDPAARLVLVYGPDTGLVSERARHLVDHYLGGTDDPFARVTIDPETLAADPVRLADEAHTLGLFGGSRVVRVRVGGGDPSPAFAPLFKTAPSAAVIVAEAGDLKPTSPLRKLFEQSKTAFALPCYADAERDLARLIDETVRQAGLQISPEARALTLRSLGADRLASRVEIEKLCLYAAGTGKIEAEDVTEILGDVSALRLDDVTDAAASGDADGLATAFRRLMAAGGDAGAVALSAARHFDVLLRLRLEREAGRPLDQAFSALRPPLHFRRRDAARVQADLWRSDVLLTAMRRLHDAAADARRVPALSHETVERTLLSVCEQARRARG